MSYTSLAELRQYADEKSASLDEGEALDALSAALIALGVSMSVTSIDAQRIDNEIAAAFDAGASLEQVQEIVALTSGLGVHTLMIGCVPVIEAARQRGLVNLDEPLDAKRQALWDKHVGDDPFWKAFSEELPGFLMAMLRMSPDLFVGFFEYCAVPWKTRTVSPQIKELAAMACDAAPSHQFGPGFRVHLANCIKLGIKKRAIMQALDIGASAAPHQGYA